MIITFFLDLVYGFLLFLIGILPLGTIPSQWVSSVYSFWQTANAFSYVFPVAALAFWVGVVAVFDVGILSFRILHWVIRKIPGVS